jgi:putative FmdB family regulatory protein
VPIYEYRCENGHNFEVLQSMRDDPVTKCEECGAPVERVFHPVAVHFKGSGFYSTDYGRRGRKRDSSDSSAPKPAESAPKADAKKQDTKKAESA